MKFKVDEVVEERLESGLTSCVLFFFSLGAAKGGKTR